jgi:hypothetical protein
VTAALDEAADAIAPAPSDEKTTIAVSSRNLGDFWRTLPEHDICNVSPERKYYVNVRIMSLAQVGCIRLAQRIMSLGRNPASLAADRSPSPNDLKLKRPRFKCY